MNGYGTGQSSLSYLKRLPLSELKIDRSFVQFAHRDRSDALLVRSALNLAHEPGLQVVAEGVEDPGASPIPQGYRLRLRAGLFDREAYELGDDPGLP